MTTTWTWWQLLRHFGPGWIAYRLRYEMARRSGWLSWRDGLRKWDGLPLSRLMADTSLAHAEHLRHRAAQFFFTTEQVLARPRALERFASLAAVSDDGVVERARRLGDGEITLFHNQRKSIGFPPDWHRHPLTGEALPADEHWSRVSDFAHGDIKAVWDVSRFAFAYDLVRTYGRTGDARWAELFWTLVEDWHANNPPGSGANWKCGQEASFRLFAWCFGLFAFLGCPATTNDRIAMLLQMVGYTGRRVWGNTGYALSQQNNHGISEAACLWTVGLLFPEIRDAARYRETGRNILEELARQLIYDDGSFVQHSWNYHRLMLQVYLWAIRLGDLNKQPLSGQLRRRVARAGDLLAQMVDLNSGDVPRYGHDDGSLVLPLNDCGYRDYRPVVQATAALTDGRRRYDDGPWDEDLLWLCGESYRRLPIEPPQQRDITSADGGYVVLRGRESNLFTRAVQFRHRPAQADMLHVDLWWRGQNIAIDPGTFSYNAPPPWTNALAEAMFHNTVTVDGQGPLQRAGRFMWLPWPKGRQLHQLIGLERRHRYWQGEHDGFLRMLADVCHRRGILAIDDDCWLVIDHVSAARKHVYRLHWLLADFPHDWDAATSRLALHTPEGDFQLQVATSHSELKASLVRGDKSSPRGWRADGYQRRVPALSLAAVVEARSACFFTLMGRAGGHLNVTASAVEVITTDRRTRVRLREDGGDSLVTDVSTEHAPVHEPAVTE